MYRAVPITKEGIQLYKPRSADVTLVNMHLMLSIVNLLVLLTVHGLHRAHFVIRNLTGKDVSITIVNIYGYIYLFI